MNSLKMQMILMDRGINDLFRMRDYLAAGGSEQAIYQLFDTKLYFKDGVVPGEEGITDAIKDAWDWLVEKIKVIVDAILNFFNPDRKVANFNERVNKYDARIAKISELLGHTVDEFERLSKMLNTAWDTIVNTAKDTTIETNSMPIIDIDAIIKLKNMMKDFGTTRKVGTGYPVLKSLTKVKISDLGDLCKEFSGLSFSLAASTGKLRTNASQLKMDMTVYNGHPTRKGIDNLREKLSELEHELDFYDSLAISPENQKLWDNFNIGVDNVMQIAKAV